MFCIALDCRGHLGPKQASSFGIWIVWISVCKEDFLTIFWRGKGRGKKVETVHNGLMHSLRIQPAWSLSEELDRVRSLTWVSCFLGKCPNHQTVKMLANEHVIKYANYDINRRRYEAKHGASWSHISRRWMPSWLSYFLVLGIICSS